LPHSIGLNTPVANGWWFHYLLEVTPGWWNNGGQDHVYFSDVIAIAIGAEMAQVRDYKFGMLMAQGFAIKGWQAGMYYTLGGKQSATERINPALYGSGEMYRICGPTTSPDNCTPFNEVIGDFAEDINEVRLDLAIPFGMIGITNNVRDLGHMVLWRSTWKNNHDPNAPYEWGNINDYSHRFSRLMAAMGDAPGTNPEQVLWYSGDRLAYVVSERQLSYLCEGKSCVHE